MVRRGSRRPGVAVGERLERLAHDLDAFVVARARQEQPRCDRATLAGVHADHARTRQGRREVGVVEDDVRRLAAELEEHPLERTGSACRDVLADRGRTGERDHVDARVAGEHVADDRRIARRDDIEHTGGMSVSSATSLPIQVARVRRVGRGLQDHRAACRERGRQLRQVQHEREVPRRDGAHDADRLPHDEAVRGHPEELVLAELVLPLVAVDEVDVPLHVVDATVLLDRVGEADRRADLGDDLRAGDLRGAFASASSSWVRQPLRNARSVDQLGLVEGTARRGDGRLHIGRVRVGDRPDHRLRRGIDVVVGRAAGRLHELPVDQHPRLVGHRHFHTPVVTLRAG